MAASYEDGFREVSAMLVEEADGFEFAAANAEGRAGQVLGAFAKYLRHIVGRLEERRAFAAEIGALAVRDDERTAFDEAPPTGGA
jgi:hypothetical protein